MTTKTNQSISKRTRKSNLPLEHFLNKANDELSNLEQLVRDKKSQIADIESQIRDRDMKDLYEYATSKGFSIDKVKQFIDKQDKQKSA